MAVQCACSNCWWRVTRVCGSIHMYGRRGLNCLLKNPEGMCVLKGWNNNYLNLRICLFNLKWVVCEWREHLVHNHIKWKSPYLYFSVRALARLGECKCIYLLILYLFIMQNPFGTRMWRLKLKIVAKLWSLPFKKTRVCGMAPLFQPICVFLYIQLVLEDKNLHKEIYYYRNIQLKFYFLIS